MKLYDEDRWPQVMRLLAIVAVLCVIAASRASYVDWPKDGPWMGMFLTCMWWATFYMSFDTVYKAGRMSGFDQARKIYLKACFPTLWGK